MKGQKAIFSKKSDHWKTPEKEYDLLNKEFSFSYDPCPFQSQDLTSLLIEWNGRVFCNPPYSNIFEFMNKALIELNKGNIEIAVFLVPSRTDSKWFHELVLKSKAEIRWIRGRLKFNGCSVNAPFPSCIIVFRKGGNYN